MSRKFCGYDLNGWKDSAARNWKLNADGENIIGEQFTTIGVLNPAVVSIENLNSSKKNQRDKWIGGAQAALAPHGKGDGWGNVGAAQRRRLVREMLSDEYTPADVLAAALSGHADGARYCAIAIDDSPATSELFQERLLAAVAAGRLGHGLLVWRSVLSVLGCLVSDENLLEPRDGLKIGVVGHVSDGFTLQKLTLRLKVEATTQFLAPERRATANLIKSHLGYEGLHSNIAPQLEASGGRPDANWSKYAQSPLGWALDGTCAPELLRNEKGHFFQVSMAKEPDLSSIDFKKSDVSALDDCDCVVFETLTTGPIKAALMQELRSIISSPLLAPDSSNVAAGALEAARRYSTGVPVYFDFLPKISTIVMGQKGAESFDLIQSTETLPAGKIYRSPRPAQFALHANQEKFDVYLRKDSAALPRKASIEIGTVMPKALQVELRVEQTPASGRAKIFIEIPALMHQFTIDWDKAEEIEVSWEDLIEKLNTSKPTIPNRMVLQSGLAPWHVHGKSSGLEELLQKNSTSRDVNWKDLSDCISSRYQREYCISSDGKIPTGISADTVNHLDTLTERAMSHFGDRVSGKIQDNNDSLRFLTWQFRRAPANLPGLLLDALEGPGTLFQRLPIDHPMTRVLLYQGFGRTCRSEQDERRAIAMLFNKPVKNWNYKCETAAIAFLLARSETAPYLLDRKHVDLLGERVLLDFKSELGTNYTRFNYAPFLMAGLLRWRMKSPRALVIGQDLLADKFSNAIKKTLSDFEKTPLKNKRKNNAAMRYGSLLLKLLDELKGKGSDASILEYFYDASS